MRVQALPPGPLVNLRKAVWILCELSSDFIPQRFERWTWARFGQNALPGSVAVQLR